MTPSEKEAWKTRRLFIDSGKIHPGFAWFVGPEFVGCGETGPTHDWADEVYFEMPQYNRKRAASPQSLIKLAAAGGLAAGRHAGPASTVQPIEVSWKGNIPKAITLQRLVDRLSADEQQRLAMWLEKVPRGKRHDLIDASYMGVDWLRGKGIRA